MALPTGATHDWELDQASGGTLPDQIGTVDLPESGAPTAVTFGRDFDGVDDAYAEVSAGALASTFDYSNVDTTVAALIKIPANQPDSVAHIFQTDTAADSETYFTLQVRSDSLLSARMEQADTGTNVEVSADMTLYDSEAILVTVRWDASAGTLTMWVNDSAITEVTADAFPSGGHGVGIGSHNGASADFMDGVVSRIITWGRLLSDSEVNDLFQEMGAYADARGEQLEGWAPTLEPAGIASEEALGAPTVVAGPVTLTPVSIASAEALGTPALAPGLVTVSTTGIASQEGVGVPVVELATFFLEPMGIPSAEVFGTPGFALGPISAQVVGVSSAEAMGPTPTLELLVTLSPMGIPSAEATGAIGTETGPISRQITAIASQEAMGVPALVIDSFVSGLVGISSEEAVPTPAIEPGSVTVMVTGIPSAEAFGVVNKTTFNHYARLYSGNVDRGPR